MRVSRVGEVLLAIGGVVGVAAVIGIVVGFEPSKLPAALLDIAVYKLTFAAAAGLLASGAIVRRYARRDNDQRSATAASEPRPSAQLGAGPAQPDVSRPRERPSPIERRPRE